MSKDWHNWDDSDSFERFCKDRSMRKKQKRSDRHSQKQKMREVSSEPSQFDDDSFEDFYNDRSNPKPR
jgi:hypothetical protein